MKRTMAIAILLCGIYSASFAQIQVDADAPHDDGKARAGVYDRPELKPLNAAYIDILHTRLHPAQA